MVGRYVFGEIAGIQSSDRDCTKTPDGLQAWPAASGGADVRKDRVLPPGQGWRVVTPDGESHPRVSWACVQRGPQDRPLSWAKPRHRGQEAQGPEEEAGFSPRR